MVFGFAQGQELSKHTAAKPAMLFVVKGEASVSIGDDVQEAQAETWIHMPAGLKHSIKAKTPVVMLPVLWKRGVRRAKAIRPINRKTRVRFAVPLARVLIQRSDQRQIPVSYRVRSADKPSAQVHYFNTYDTSVRFPPHRP